MLDEPKYGWTHVMFGGQCLGTASYLTDVPVDCMERMIAYLLKDTVMDNFSIEFDAEGYTFGLIEFSDSLFWIHDNTEDGCPVLAKLNPESLGLMKYATVNEIMIRLAKELIDDIQSNKNEWIYWDCMDEDESEIEKREEKINNLLVKLKNLI